MNTPNKRSSALLLTLPWRNQYPLPDAALSQADRQQCAKLYAGILADPPSGAVYDTAKFNIVGQSRNTSIIGERRSLIIQGQARNTMIWGNSRNTEVQ